MMLARVWLFTWTVCWLGLIHVNGGAHASQPVTTHPALDYFAAPSRDGRYLAFVSERAGNPDIWLKPLTKGVYALPRRLTHYPGYDGFPSLNATGSQLLYVSHKTDPRGDIYLLDVLSGKEERLTDVSSSDSFPVWGRDSADVYFLKEEAIGGVQGLFRLTLRDHTLTRVVEQVSSFTLGPGDWIVFSDGQRLQAVRESEPQVSVELTMGETMDLWPFFVDPHTVAFTRYEDDTDGNGRIDTNDESSIWLTRWDFEAHRQETLYRVTPAGEFHVYPAGGGGVLFYSDLQAGDLIQQSLQDFFESYRDIAQARDLATRYLDRGQTEQALVMMSNISTNLVSTLSPAEQADFDLSFVELLRDAKRYVQARSILDRYADSKGRLGALYRIHSLSVGVERQVGQVSREDLRRIVRSMSKQFLAIGSEQASDSFVRDVAFLEAGKLFMLTQEPMIALTFLSKLEKGSDNDVRAKALFTRGKIYRGLGEDAKLLQVFIDVIHLFGEEHSWGKRAVAQAIAVSEQSNDFRHKIAAVDSLPQRFPSLPFLSASALLRVADLYEEEGELMKGVESLDQIINEYDSQRSLVIQAYRRKGQMLAAAQEYEAAAETYTTLVSMTGVDRQELEEAQRLMVLQRVNSAIKQRTIGEVRIAAKELKDVVETHPESVEGHRAYIETKWMLGQTERVQEQYATFSKQQPKNAILRYGWGLAESYSKTPDFPKVVGLLEEAIQLDQSISYFHQTLGWAYEQSERRDPHQGYLERAEQEYRIALELTDAFQFPQVEGNLLLNLGNTYMALGNYPEAYRHYKKRDELSLHAGEDLTERLYRTSFGEACFKVGKSEEAIRHYQTALRLVPEDTPASKAQLLERLGLSYQDTREYSEAIRYFSQALQLNLEIGETQNLALLKRNIGVNLYNLSTSGKKIQRDSLKDALQSYFSSLETIAEYGVRRNDKGLGFFHVDVALGEGSGAAIGFDQRGEQKLMFSYIASTYEKLAEPDRAKDYYLKKLSLFEEQSEDLDVSERTEKAILLNRLGVLFHQLGDPEAAFEFLERSLGLTREVGLDYGTLINLYNLTRMASERLYQQKRVSRNTLDLFVSVLEEIAERGNLGKVAALTYANVAFLLSDVSMPSRGTLPVLYDAAREHHWAYEARRRGVSYYKKAISILELNPSPSPNGHVPLLVSLRLNLMELAYHSGLDREYRVLQDDLYKLVDQASSRQDWILPLQEAVHTQARDEQEALLERAFVSFMERPVQAYPRGESFLGLSPMIDTLLTRYVDLLVNRQAFDRAFQVAEQIHMRRMAFLLYDDLGLDFFLTGLGEYQEEVGSQIRALRGGGYSSGSEAFGEWKQSFEDLMLVLLEEYPWSVPWFSQFALTSHLLSRLVSEEQPYVKIVPGSRGNHLFIHTGKALRYLPAPFDGSSSPLEDLPELRRAKGLYVSSVSGLPDTWLFGRLLDIPRTSIPTIYDLFSAYSQRSVVYSRVGVTGFTKLPDLPEGNVPLTFERFKSDADSNQQLLAKLDVLIAGDSPRKYSFDIGTKQEVREYFHLRDLSPEPKHSVLVFNIEENDPTETELLVAALIRAGFPHVVIRRGSFSRSDNMAMASSYLMNLQHERPDWAFEKARRGENVAQASGETATFYGYAGMSRRETETYAEESYEKTIEDGVERYQTQDYPAALKRFETALSLNPFTAFPEDIFKLTKLSVDTSLKMKDYDKALFYQHKLLEYVDRHQLTDERPEVLYRLGILYSRVEQFESAITYLGRAITYWEQHDELDRLAEGISQLGVIKENMGKYGEALQAFGRSFDLYREMDEVGDMAGEYQRIGRIKYLRLGRYVQARKSLQAALTIYQSLGNRRAEAATLFEIGLTYEKVGLFEDADVRYRQGKMIGDELEDPFVQGTGELYLANTQWFRGQYQRAFQHLSAAERLNRQAKDSQLDIMIANTKGLIYWTLNEIEKGLVHLQRALSVAMQEDIPTEIASTHNNLGLMYRERGELEKSLNHFTLAQDIDRRLNSRWGLGYDNRNIGISLMKMKRFAEAEKHFLDAETISVELHNTTNWVKALLELGNLNVQVKRWDQADRYYTETFTRAKQFGLLEVMWRAAAGKAAVLRQEGKKEEALSWYVQGVSIVEGLRASLKIEEFRNSFQLNKQDLYSDIISLLVELNRTNEAFDYLERSRARSFIDLLGNQKITLKSQVDQRQWESVQALSAQVAQQIKEIGTFEEAPEDLLEQYRQSKAAYEEALLLLKQNNPALSNFVAVDPLTLTDVEQLLAPAVGLLSYKLFNDRILVWLITKNGTRFYEVPLRDVSIPHLVKQYRTLVQRLEPVDEELATLYSLLIEPVDRDLHGLEFLGIIPDGALHFLSFSALKGQMGYLVDRFPIFYSPSASVLKYTFARRSTQKQSAVLAVGNPDLGNFNNDLPFAEFEAKSMRWNFPQMDILTGPKATKEWFVQHISKYGIIHLAAHGEFDDFNPLLSSLWFASSDPDNRQLTVKEVFGLDIRADLVTLSACQTGLGQLRAGEMIGLNRAFLYAGTHALVSALWRVDDLSTSVLMKHFYRQYVTRNKAQSLRQAQLIVKRDFPHPSYWAGITLVGDYQ